MASRRSRSPRSRRRRTRSQERLANDNRPHDLFTRLFVACSFVALVPVLPLSPARWVSVAWGAFLLSVLTYFIAKSKSVNPVVEIAEHLFVAAAVVVLSQLIGSFIGRVAYRRGLGNLGRVGWMTDIGTCVPFPRRGNGAQALSFRAFPQLDGPNALRVRRTQGHARPSGGWPDGEVLRPTRARKAKASSLRLRHRPCPRTPCRSGTCKAGPGARR